MYFKNGIEFTHFMQFICQRIKGIIYFRKANIIYNANYGLKTHRRIFSVPQNVFSAHYSILSIFRNINIKYHAHNIIIYTRNRKDVEKKLTFIRLLCHIFRLHSNGHWGAIILTTPFLFFVTRSMRIVDNSD